MMEHAVVVFLHKLKGQEDVSCHRVAGGKMVLEVFCLEKKKKITNVIDPYELGMSWSYNPAWAQWLDVAFGSTLCNVDVRRL